MQPINSTGLLEWFNGTLSNGALSPTLNNPLLCPLGFKYHLVDVFVKELEKCSCDALTGDKVSIKCFKLIK